MYKLENFAISELAEAFDYPDDWVADTTYSLGDFVSPTVKNDLKYECTVAGDSHATTEPTWPTTPGETVVDNEVTWTCRALTIEVKAGEGALYPDDGNFKLTLCVKATAAEPESNHEIVLATARDTDVITIGERAQEGTSAVAHAAGELVALRITKGVMEAKQPKIYAARCYLTNTVSAAHQVIPTGSTARQRAMLDGVVSDPDDLFDRSQWSGETTGVATGKLIDSGASFDSHCVGAIVWNMTDNTYTHVTAFDSSTQLSVNAGVPSGKDYVVYHCVFVAPKTGLYMVTAVCMFESLSQGKWMFLALRKQSSINSMPATASEAFSELVNARTGRIGSSLLSMLELSEGNTVGVDVIHDEGTNANLMRDTHIMGRYTWMSVMSIS